MGEKIQIKCGNNISLRYDPYIAISVVVTLLACFAGNKENAVLSCVILVGYALLIVKPIYLVGPILFLTVFDDYLVAFSGGQSFGRFCVLLFILGVLFNSKGIMYLSKDVKKLLPSMILLIALSIVLSFWGTYSYTSLPTSYVINILMAIALMTVYVDSIEVLKTSLSIFSILAIGYIVVLMLQTGIENIAYGNRNSLVADVNANDLAAGLGCIICLVFCSYMMGFYKKTYLYLPLLLITYVALFLTGSRTSLIATVATMIILMICNMGIEKRQNYKTIFIVLIILIVVIMAFRYMQSNYPILMQRFTYQSVVDSKGTSRIDVWKAFFTEIFPKYWMFGVGFDQRNFYYMIQAINGQGHGAHNLIVELLDSFGIIGVIIYARMYFKWIQVAVQNMFSNPLVLYALAIIIFSIVCGIGENTARSRMLWLGLGLLFTIIHSKDMESDDIY